MPADGDRGSALGRMHGQPAIHTVPGRQRPQSKRIQSPCMRAVVSHCHGTSSYKLRG